MAAPSEQDRAWDHPLLELLAGGWSEKAWPSAGTEGQALLHTLDWVDEIFNTVSWDGLESLQKCWKTARAIVTQASARITMFMRARTDETMLAALQQWRLDLSKLTVGHSLLIPIVFLKRVHLQLQKITTKMAT